MPQKCFTRPCQHLNKASFYSPSAASERCQHPTATCLCPKVPVDKKKCSICSLWSKVNSLPSHLIRPAENSHKSTSWLDTGSLSHYRTASSSTFQLFSGAILSNPRALQVNNCSFLPFLFSSFHLALPSGNWNWAKNGSQRSNLLKDCGVLLSNVSLNYPYSPLVCGKNPLWQALGFWAAELRSVAIWYFFLRRWRMLHSHSSWGFDRVTRLYFCHHVWHSVPPQLPSGG